ncbi:MAG: methionyl-tRNA formyltransferase [Pseudomonadales bacterium]
MATASAPPDLNVVFAGTPEFAAHALQALIDAASYNLCAVYSQPDRPSGRGRRLLASPVKQLAQQHSIDIYQPQNFRNPEALEELCALHPDVLVVAAYGLLLPKSVLDLPTYGCINIHASLLPRWRGAAPIERAIEAGDSETGISIMQMDEGLDTGPVLATQNCSIDSTETGESLRAKLSTIGATCMLQCLSQLTNDTLQPQPQDEARATYANKINKQELEIDWRLPASEIERKLRAFYSACTMHSTLGDMRIKIASAELTGDTCQRAPGVIVEVLRDAILVACGDGALRIVELQLPGGKMLSAQAILNAKKSLFQPGSAFETPA